MPRVVICIDCKREKPHKSNGRCNACAQKAWRLANPERSREIQGTSYLRHREERNEVSRAYYAANRDRLLARQRMNDAARVNERRAYNKEYRRCHRDELSEYLRIWKENNPERMAVYATRAPEYTRRWRERNLEQARLHGAEHERRRRARKRETTVEEIWWEEVYLRDNGMCGICSKPVTELKEFSIDHIIPLSRGGTHTYDNVQLAHLTCNRRKGARVDH